MGDAADRDRARFEALVIEHHARVRAFVRSLGVGAAWVDDVAQEAFLAAYRDRGSFDDGRDFGPWVRGIAANLVRNEARKEARRRRIWHAGLALALIDRAEAADEPPEVEAVRECVEGLDPASRRVVLGRYRDGMTAEELAGGLGLSAANVRQRLVRLRRRVRACVERRVARAGGRS